LARDVVLDDLRNSLGASEQGFQVHACVEAHGLEHVHQVFGADVAARSRRKRAATEARDGGIEAGDAGLHCSHSIRQAHSSRVVEVSGQVDVRPFVPYLRAKLVHLPRVGHASRVAERHALNTQIDDLLNDP